MATGKPLTLYGAAKKPVETVLGGEHYTLRVRIHDSFGDDAFSVTMKPSPARVKSPAPRRHT